MGLSSDMREGIYAEIPPCAEGIKEGIGDDPRIGTRFANLARACISRMPANWSETIFSPFGRVFGLFPRFFWPKSLSEQLPHTILTANFARSLEKPHGGFDSRGRLSCQFALFADFKCIAEHGATFSRQSKHTDGQPKRSHDPRMPPFEIAEHREEPGDHGHADRDSDVNA